MNRGLLLQKIAKSLLCFVTVGLISVSVKAGVIVTVTNPGMEISADNAANAANPSFTNIGTIVIAETNANDFSSTGGKFKTLVLSAPAGWVFNKNAGKVYCNGKDIKAAFITVTPVNIIVKLMVVATRSTDVINISGVEIQATDGRVIHQEVSICRTAANPGTAMMKGIVNASKLVTGTSFFTCSQVGGMATKLAFSNKPVASTAGVVFEQQPVIVAQDQFGNITSNGIAEGQKVKIKLSAGTGSLGGTVSVQFTGGVAFYSDLKLDLVGTKKLMATSGTLSFAVSNEFTITESEPGTRLSSEDSDDYDPDWICTSGSATINPLA
ncbi:MAG: hypothetical protein JST81_12795 [Bacteroidetes bacterium]|nr:hypothetical protein [Bacteroidota bacterium]